MRFPWQQQAAEEPVREVRENSPFTDAVIAGDSKLGPGEPTRRRIGNRRTGDGSGTLESSVCQCHHNSRQFGYGGRHAVHFGNSGPRVGPTGRMRLCPENA